ncbi:beta-lactamase-like protein [Mycena amicta]|nr:beta-lactamase-like protein [Mycena amicta]
MESLEALASVTRLSENTVRILGQNPGKFTLHGTNTYLVGKKRPFTLVDAGEGRAEYTPLLEAVLKDSWKTDQEASDAGVADVSDIIISHWHHDHVGGLPAVLDLLRRLWAERNRHGSAPFVPPRLHKFPSAEPAKQHNKLPAILASLPAGSYNPGPTGDVFHDLHDTQILPSSGLRVLHTPGHTTDSIALYFPRDDALYTADTVLGHGTAVFEDLATYLRSLQTMLALVGKGKGGDMKLYPGHGPVVPSGKLVIQTYITHRLEREAQLLQLLKSPSPIGSQRWTTWTLVATLYATYPESLWLPAARGVHLHLRKLEGEGILRRVGGEGKDTQWVLQRSSANI